MKINEVMKRTGLSRKAIYIYEERSLLSPAKNTAGYREYSEGDVEQLLFIAKLRELGLSLDEIAQLLQNPEETDILMQKHFDRTQRELSETMQRLSQVQTVLYNLPPNGQLEDLVRAADIAIPQDRAIAAAQYLSEELASSSARRLAMHMFEAFLDLPLDTPDRWNAWYELLEALENVGAPLWDGFETYYGGMSAEQKYEDYRLRRDLVVGYTKFTPEDEDRKAREIIAAAQRLLSDGEYALRWSSYYQLVVRPSLYDPGCPSLISEAHIFSRLSSVYHSYNQKFQDILARLVYPYFQTPEGRLLHRRLQETLSGAWDPSPNAMIYFDFFNNTLERLLPQIPD